MFAPYCATCRRRVLLGTRRVTRIDRPPDGRMVVVLRCVCGRLVADEIRPPTSRRDEAPAGAPGPGAADASVPEPVLAEAR